MSAMAEMVADMMLKALPEEVRQFLTPENLNAIKEKVIERWGLVEQALAVIGTGVNATHETTLLTQGMIMDMTETLAAVRASQERIETHVGSPIGDSGAKPVTRSRTRRALPNGTGSH